MEIIRCNTQFDEYTVVLKGCLVIETKSGIIEVKAREAIITYKGEWIKYSTPNEDTEYIAVCLTTFSIDMVNRDE